MYGNDIAAISARLKELRTFSDYTTAQVAEMLGVDEEEYVAYESGTKEIPINLIYKFADVMETEAAYVMSGVLPSKDKVYVVYDGKGMSVKRYEGYSFTSLGGDFRKKTMNPMLVTIAPTDTPELVVHGGNDAQKTMGLIWMLLIASGYAADNGHLPPWVVISCYGAIGFGTLFGGWRIVKTMGQKITKLKPVGGFCAETGGAMTLFIATALGIPVSTTHTITGAIVGVGSAQKTSAVRWGVAGNIVWAWILTIPASAFIAAIAWWVGTKIL